MIPYFAVKIMDKKRKSIHLYNVGVNGSPAVTDAIYPSLRTSYIPGYRKYIPISKIILITQGPYSRTSYDIS